jgi:NAD(P)-dependent dehydrogenase (short-subunit alcohol dehydrogenase family)
MTINNSTTKIAIVTGGSRGIGRSTVENLAKRGVHSIFTYNSNHTEAEKVVGLVAEAGQKAIALQLDTGRADHALTTFAKSGSCKPCVPAFVSYSHFNSSSQFRVLARQLSSFSGQVVTSSEFS